MSAPPIAPVDVEAAVRFVRAIHGHERAGFAILMLMRRDQSPAHYGVDLSNPQWGALRRVLTSYAGADCYIGVAVYAASPQPGKNRTKDMVLHCHWLWCERDNHALPETLPEPTFTIETSDGNYQDWWRMDAPLSPTYAEDYAERIAGAVGCAPMKDATRVLRIVGMRNHKPERMGEIARKSDETGAVYSLGDFAHLPRISAPAAPIREGGTRGRIGEGSRHHELVSLAGSLRRRGLSRDTILAALRGMNEMQCDPPKPDAEIEKIATDASGWEPAPVEPVSRSQVALDSVHPLQPTDATGGGWTPKITYLSDVQPEHVRHLWPGRIPLGKLTVVDGDPGLGKTTVLLDIAARLTTGAAMPDGTRGDLDGPAGVVIITAEDGLADTIRPRLDAAGADVSRVVALECLVNGEEERSLTLTDLDAIEEAVRKVGAKLVVVDPLMAFLSSETNSYRDQDMRRILAPIARLAERLGCAIVVIRHLSKGGGTNAVYRGGGSIGIIASARCGLLVAADPEDETGARRIVAVTKSNLAAMPPALAYTLQPAANGTAYVAWEGATGHTAKQLLAMPEDDEERGARDEAADILRQSLAAGPRPAKEITDAAAKAGISPKTLRTARKKLGILPRREGGLGGDGHWMWELPKMPTDAPNMPNVPTETNGHLRHLSDRTGILDATATNPPATSRPITERDLPHIFPGYREAAADV